MSGDGPGAWWLDGPRDPQRGERHPPPWPHPSQKVSGWSTCAACPESSCADCPVTVCPSCGGPVGREKDQQVVNGRRRTLRRLFQGRKKDAEGH